MTAENIVNQLVSYVIDVDVDEGVSLLQDIAASEGHNYVVDEILDAFLLKIGENGKPVKGYLSQTLMFPRRFHPLSGSHTDGPLDT